jgi:hypothetical protein
LAGIGSGYVDGIIGMVGVVGAAAGAREAVNGTCLTAREKEKRKEGR